ncbi:MAG: helix-turn-helix domain-containing protein [Oscillospiraceae bacterium]|nr:helix-turn-helix domain-containing protein [Oscillospiraceae bacterium]
MNFSGKLQKLRKEKGMSQENLAEALDVSRQAISKWESGQSYPETEKLLTLSEMFGVTLDSLIRDGDIQQAGSNSGNTEKTVVLHMRGNFEYKSERTLFGLPLVHINIGWGPKKAKGIIAIGNISSGVISIGIASIGVISIGVAGAGIIGIGALSLGLLLAIGAISIGTFSIGAVAMGIFTLGAVSIGMFSYGAASLASHVAIGDWTWGHIAIGRIVNGVKTIEVERAANHGGVFAEVSREQMRILLDSEFPQMWQWIKDFITGFFRQ